MPRIYKCDDDTVYYQSKKKIVVERKHIKDVYIATRSDSEGTNGNSVTFTKTNQIKVGDEVYIIAETENAVDLRIDFNLKQGVEKGIVEVDQAITLQQDGKDVDYATTRVGAYCNDANVENKDDFKNWAIAKITVQPLDEGKQKVWSEALEGLPDKKSKFYIVADAHSRKEKDYLITYHGRNPDDEGKPDHKTTPNRWLDIDGKWLELGLHVINIHHTGHISKIDLSKAKKVSYIYYDVNENKHDLGTFDVIQVQKWIDGTRHEWKTEEGGEWKTVTVGSKTRYYKKDGENKNQLITPFSGTPKSFKYNDGETIDFAIYEDTNREYFNPEAFATLIGALAEVNYKDVVSNGSVGTDGTGAESLTHFNGYNMDFKYLRTDKKKANIDKDSNGNTIIRILVSSSLLDISRQNKFLDALHKFGWGVTEKNLAHKTNEDSNLNHCEEDDHHKNHLHIQGFKANYKL